MTYPKVTEIGRQEWEPEQVAATEAEMHRRLNEAEPGLKRSAHSSKELEQQRYIPTVCPKR